MSLTMNLLEMLLIKISCMILVISMSTPTQAVPALPGDVDGGGLVGENTNIYIQGENPHLQG